MLNIILCDDDLFTLNIFSELIVETVDALSIEGSILCKASSSKEVLQFLNNNPGEYLIFLDLDLGRGELNGLDLAKVIREKWPQSKLVFVTSHIEKSMNILKSGVEPFGFIEKDLNRRIMMQEFKKCFLLLSKKKVESTKASEIRSIRLPIGIDEEVTIPVERIAYVEAVKTIAHNICYHTLDHSKITVRDTIKNALELLGDGFVQSHRSVIVNSQYVIGVENGQLKLSNGVYVACSMSKVREFLGKKEKR